VTAVQLADCMFVGAQTVVDASFETACGRLEELARDGWLLGVSGAAHAAWGRGVARVGPAGAVPGLSRLVEVRFQNLAIRGGMAVMVLRWEAAGSGGGLFPVLDADIALSRSGQSQTLLVLTGAYRPPLGQLGAALDRVALRRVATATIKRFVIRLADALTDPGGTSMLEEGGSQHTGVEQITAAPGDDGDDPEP
jgi:hypothetical protein